MHMVITMINKDNNLYRLNIFQSMFLTSVLMGILKEFILCISKLKMIYNYTLMMCKAQFHHEKKKESVTDYLDIPVETCYRAHFIQ